LLTALIALDEAGLLLSFEGKGHALAGPIGADIVCAAFTVLARTAWESLEGVQGLKVEGAAPSPGSLRFELVERGEAQEGIIKGITDFLLTGLKGLERDYPGRLDVSVTRERRKSDGT
jgi:uncharacterized protein YsxB (DUF464 family)